MRKATVKLEQKRERGEGRIFARGRIFWIQYYRRGVQIRESAGTDNERKARILLRKKTGAVANGIVQDSRSLRYKNIRDAYMEDCVLAENKSLRRNKKTVYLESVRRLDRHFEGFRVVEINADEIRKFQTDLKKTGLKNGTINRSVAALRRMFVLAQQNERISHVPFFKMLKEATARQGTLPHDKYNALLNALPDYIRPVVAIAYATGMRRGEILGLRWDNIKWMDCIIRIEDSKNGKAREIPFNDKLETALKEQYAKRQEGCDFVCYRVNRLGHAQRVGNFRKVWSRVCVKLDLAKMEPVVDGDGNPVFERKRYEHSKPLPKLRYSGLLLHDLRRTFISDAEHAGAPRHEVMKMSGHETEEVYKRYAIGERENRRAALAQIDTYRAKKFGDTSGTVEASAEHVGSVIN